MNEVVIASAVRTPIGTFLGALSNESAVDLGAIVIKEAIQRANIRNEDVQEVLMGNVLQAGLGQGPARQSMLKAGLPQEVPATTINKLCGSGLKSIIMAAQAIRSGDADLMVAGGMENMSLAPYLVPRVRTGLKFGDGQLIDSLSKDGLTCAVANILMGETAENLARKYGITREAQDEFALDSQCKAEAAIQSGRFKDEIVKVEVRNKKGQISYVEQDEHPRSGLTIEQLNKLKPAFLKEGTVTPGNASGINDGAAAVVICSLSKAKQLGLTPLARIRSYAYTGVDPSLMGIGPVSAVKSALVKAGMNMGDIQLIELNEAFAAQALSVLHELNADRSIVNVNGGAIALGHPIGASGARIVTTLLYEMKKRQLETGLASLCVGGGHGVSMILEQL
jgi:acetyl-CoA C-acetyltransferase